MRDGLPHSGLRWQRLAALTCRGRAKDGKKAAPQCGYRLQISKQRGIAACFALPRGNAVFERFGELLVNELKREAFFEVSHHP